MAKKKKKLSYHQQDFSGVVYSTDPDYSSDEAGGYGAATLPPQQQNLRIHLMRFKGNKQATVVREFMGTESDLKDLGKMLKSKCGTGGSVKDGEIIVQGDKRQQVAAVLDKEGYKYKFVGG
ncbi:MAG TPA: translation initiation factor [Bacteroidetes bacterium]|nr:translation initiation factor [Bacteroidota bacterium]